MLRRTGIRVNNLVAVVDRLQGARQMLQEQRVDLHTKVEIDDDFLREHSKYPERALEYSKDPTAWSENYLRQNGALALVQTFDPNGGKLPRAKAFLERYQKVLEASHKLGPLDLAVNIKYGQHLKEILGAKA